MKSEKFYFCIDLKSFFASCECVRRGLDPFKTNLVVADKTRGNGAICLAVSPAMKLLGVKNRCRIFEIPKNIKYITAMPHMKTYMEMSANVYAIYLKFFSKEDIHIYSIDECFIDVTKYLTLYKKPILELAKVVADEVLSETGITATVGVGTNLFLAKVALDITAKHAKNGIGYLDENLFKKTIWEHTPITDIWNIGRGTAKRLERFGIFNLYGIAHASKELLFKEFGINAELLIDHANGIEPCTIEDIKNYKTKSRSISNGQILFEDYNYQNAMTVLKEMIDQIVLELVTKKLVTNSISLCICYSKDIQKSTGGSKNLGVYTNSFEKVQTAFLDLYQKTTRKDCPIRKLCVGLNNLLSKEYKTVDFFTDQQKEDKEQSVECAVIKIKDKFGKNALLKGISLDEKATAKKRNTLVGGHNE